MWVMLINYWILLILEGRDEAKKNGDAKKKPLNGKLSYLNQKTLSYHQN